MARSRPVVFNREFRLSYKFLNTLPFLISEPTRVFLSISSPLWHHKLPWLFACSSVSIMIWLKRILLTFCVGPHYKNIGCRGILPHNRLYAIIRCFPCISGLLTGPQNNYHKFGTLFQVRYTVHRASINQSHDLKTNILPSTKNQGGLQIYSGCRLERKLSVHHDLSTHVLQLTYRWICSLLHWCVRGGGAPW